VAQERTRHRSFENGYRRAGQSQNELALSSPEPQKATSGNREQLNTSELLQKPPLAPSSLPLELSQSVRECRYGNSHPEGFWIVAEDFRLQLREVVRAA
jgi:hypothetical protein